MALEKLPGVTSATVSLEEGLVTVVLADDNALTLTDLRHAIRERGFSPREARVRVSGLLELVEDGASLRIPRSGWRYRLVGSGPIPDRIREVADAGVVVIVVGTVAPSGDGEAPRAIGVSAVLVPGG